MARALARRGAIVIDADAIAREVVQPGRPGLAAVVERFGPEVLDGGGRLDRPKLAALVFDDAGRRMAAQASDAERRKVADVVLDNSGPPDELEAQIDSLWAQLTASLRA